MGARFSVEITWRLTPAEDVVVRQALEAFAAAYPGSVQAAVAMSLVADRAQESGAIGAGTPHPMTAMIPPSAIPTGPEALMPQLTPEQQAARAAAAADFRNGNIATPLAEESGGRWEG